MIQTSYIFRERMTCKSQLPPNLASEYSAILTGIEDILHPAAVSDWDVPHRMAVSYIYIFTMCPTARVNPLARRPILL